MVKLEQLLLAREALMKIANSGTIPAKYAWSLAGFMDEVNDKFRHFDNIRQNIATELKDEKDFDEERFRNEIENLLEEEIEIDFSILSEEALKTVEGLTVVEIMSIRSLME